MRTFLTIWKREVDSFFLSPVAYTVMVFFLLILGFGFWFEANLMSTGYNGITVLKEIFGGFFFWLANLIVVPLITMRVFSEEKKSGTLESLMTTPVSDRTVVWAKYFGVYFFYVVLWLPTIAYPFILNYLTGQELLLDPGMLIGTYLGVFLLGSMFVSIGVFSSSLSNNQIVAGMISFCILTALFMFGFLPYFSKVAWIREVSTYFSSIQHMLDFSRGAIDTRPIVYNLTTTLLMIFFTTRVLESRQWK